VGEEGLKKTKGHAWSWEESVLLHPAGQPRTFANTPQLPADTHTQLTSAACLSVFSCWC